MRYVLNLISFFMLSMLVGAGSLVLGTGRAGAQEQPCTATIQKVADPADDTTFNFSISGDIVGELNLSDPGDPSTFVGLGIDDTITITENVPPGWTLASIECTEGTSDCGTGVFEPCLTATVVGNSVTFFCEDNDLATCVFTNVRSSDPIPTLSEWGLIAMAGLMAVVGLFIVMRRRKAAA